MYVRHIILVVPHNLSGPIGVVLINSDQLSEEITYAIRVVALDHYSCNVLESEPSLPCLALLNE
jgi:hypothetical protein